MMQLVTPIGRTISSIQFIAGDCDYLEDDAIVRTNSELITHRSNKPTNSNGRSYTQYGYLLNTLVGAGVPCFNNLKNPAKAGLNGQALFTHARYP